MKRMHEIAREDLDRLDPATWVQVHAERLCEAVEEVESSRARTASGFMRSARINGAGSELALSVQRALVALGEATGWPGRSTVSLRQRWAAATAFARSVRAAVSSYTDAVSSAVSPEAARESARVSLRGLLSKVPEGLDDARAAAYRESVEKLLSHPALSKKS